MPIPVPHDNETQDDFISRCMGDDVMNTEYPDNTQRAAVCHTSWRENMKNKMKLDTKNIADVEIFQAGKWKDVEFTEKDLDEMVINFNNKICEPYLNINHSDKTTKQFKDILKVLSLGFIDNLKRKGRSLIAGFKQVPKVIAELIEAGALKQKSIEVWKKYKHANGKLYNNVIEAVTFFGADGTPAVSTLNDFVALYKNELTEQQLTTSEDKVSIEMQGMVKEKEKNYKTKQEAIVDKVEIAKKEYDELLTLKKDHDQSLNEIETFKTEITKLKADIKERDDKIKDLEKFKVDTEEEKKVNLKTEAETFVDGIINDGKIMPKFKDKYVSDYIRCKNDGDEFFKMFKEDIESREKILNLGELQSDNGGLNLENFKGENPEEAQKAVDLLMKKEKLSFEDACKKLGIGT
jgi:hypothetical protein